MARRAEFDRDEIDWALAEALAYGSLVLEGTTVRLAGQDTRRGTFSQRHSVLVDQVNEIEYEPLNHLSDEQARFMVYDTVLSEYAALGFEYGYSIASDALVCWEAQFGDFANVAQVIIDQFIVAAADKWGQHSSLSLLLPHGFDGPGSRALECPHRALPHAVRRAEPAGGVPVDGRAVLPRAAAPGDRGRADPARVLHAQALPAHAADEVARAPTSPTARSRSSSTTAPHSTATQCPECCCAPGSSRHELMDERDAQHTPVAVVRIEQLYPWPEAQIVAALDAYPNAREVWWVQEEPSNMGAWTFVHERLRSVLADRGELRSIARSASASPASGSMKIHDREQRELITAAFAGLSNATGVSQRRYTRSW